MANSHVLTGATVVADQVTVRRIGFSDLKDALKQGVDDFNAMPTHAIFLCAIYPVIGIVLAQLAFGYSILPLVYPLASGFALIGPFAALGLYELSRRREMGQEVTASHAFDVLHSSSIGAIVALGFVLLVVFSIWIDVAYNIYVGTMGYAPPTSVGQFAQDVFGTKAGWTLIILGNLVGLMFAALVLTIGVMSFPLLVDRDVGAANALLTSIRAVALNPLPMAAWGLIVAAMLFLGSLPLFLGLTVVLPILGHATWHLYRKVVDADFAPHPRLQDHAGARRSAADFPVSLVPWSK